MKATVEHISLFRHCMNGWVPCPRCGRDERWLLDTTNEYENYCLDCDIRYTREGEVYE